jgi:hypothetical protein
MCDDLLAAYKREARLFGNVVLNIPGVLGDDSRVTTQEAAHLLVKCRDASVALTVHLRQEHSNHNEDSNSGAEEDEVQIIALKADAVMCEMTGCERPARFLGKYKGGALRPVCEKHATAITRWNSADSSNPK